MTYIGIIGSGRVAVRFMSEVTFVSEVTVKSVFNPNRESGMEFAEKFSLDIYTSRLEDFFEGIDGIYIASPHETHYEYARQALLHHKHVLCEKPLAFAGKQAEELFRLARQKSLVLLEAVKTAYCPGFIQMMTVAKSGVIGEIRDVEACFTRLTPPEYRELRDIEYGGSFTELGSYTLLPILKLMGEDYREIRFDSLFAENGVDTYTKVSFVYPQGMALAKNGLSVKSEGQLLISGTRGYILARSPWWLTQSFEVRFEDPLKIESYSAEFLGEGLRYEISDFVSMINSRRTDSDKCTEKESIAMAKIYEQFIYERKNRK